MGVKATKIQPSIEEKKKKESEHQKNIPNRNPHQDIQNPHMIKLYIFSLFYQ